MSVIIEKILLNTIIKILNIIIKIYLYFYLYIDIF